MRAGTVDVVVRPPVPTDGWRVADLDRHIAEIRDGYTATFEQLAGPLEAEPRTEAAASA